MRKLAIVVLALLLTACSPAEPDGSGTLRYEIFQQCMTLTAKLQSPSEQLSTTESEVGDVVDECSQESYYMSNHITTRG